MSAEEIWVLIAHSTVALVACVVSIILFRMCKLQRQFMKEIALIEEMLKALTAPSSSFSTCCIVLKRHVEEANVVVTRARCTPVTEKNHRFIVAPLARPVDKVLEFEEEPDYGILDCNSCKHKFACLLGTRDHITYQPIGEKAKLQQEKWAAGRYTFGLDI